MEDWTIPKNLVDKLLSAKTQLQICDLQEYIEPLKSSINAHPAPNAYSRKVLFQDERGEILIMRWAENVFCYPHDHAVAEGFVVLLDGEFVERDYVFDGELVEKGARNAKSPSIFPFEKNRIHDMKCLQEGYSLHVYTPAITGMKVYDVENRRTLLVDDSCGAWIPTDDEKVLNIENWV